MSYRNYKSSCDPVWDVKIISGQSDDYYSSLIDELIKCRDGRIYHTEECGTFDIGHIKAIVKIDRLIKRAERQLEIEHARRYEEMEMDIEETLRKWGRRDNGYLTQKLKNVPRVVLIEYLTENQECVDEWLLFLFGHLHEPCSLSAERCRIPTDHLIYLLLRITESREPCIDINDLLLAKTQGVKAAYKSLGVPPLILK